MRYTWYYFKYKQTCKQFLTAKFMSDFEGSI